MDVWKSMRFETEPTRPQNPEYLKKLEYYAKKDKVKREAMIREWLQSVFNTKELLAIVKNLENCIIYFNAMENSVQYQLYTGFGTPIGAKIIPYEDGT